MKIISISVVIQVGFGSSEKGPDPGPYHCYLFHIISSCFVVNGSCYGKWPLYVKQCFIADITDITYNAWYLYKLVTQNILRMKENKFNSRFAPTFDLNKCFNRSTYRFHSARTHIFLSYHLIWVTILSDLPYNLSYHLIWVTSIRLQNNF